VSRRPAGKAHPLEWAIGLVSALLVAGLIGFVLAQAIGEASRIPEITARVDAIDATAAGGYRVRFTAENQGNASAAAVEISGTLESPDGENEESTVTLDYVPAFSQASGWLLFERDPKLGRLKVTPKGFAEP
jgi:uncharacterized protein (TIGR02588 family)